MAKKKKEIIEEKPQGEDNQPQGDREQDHIGNIVADNTELIRDVVGTLQSMHERMNEIENRLAKVADRLGF
jgi:hypothetical protein